MEYKRIFKDGIHLFAGKLGTVVISLISMMILARILSTEQMGKYSLFLMIVNLALIVGLNWADTSVVRHGREEYIKSKKVNESFWARIYLFIPVLFLFTIIFIIFRNQISKYIGINPGLITLLIVLFVLNGLLNFLTYLYQSINKMKKSAYVLFSQKLLYLIILSLVFLKSSQTSLATIVLVMNISFVLALIINMISFDFDKILPYKFNKEQFKKIWKYSWPQLIGFPGIYVINYIDIYVIKKFMTIHDVGVYNLAYSIFSNVTLFIMIMYSVSMPLIVEYRAKRKFESIKKHIRKAPIFVSTWMILVLIGLVLSKFIVPLIFSEKYAESVAPFNILLIASIFYFVSIYLLPIVNAFDLILYSQIFNLVKAGVNIAGDFILVPKIGIIGAAYATLASYLIGMILSITLLTIKKKKIFGESAK